MKKNGFTLVELLVAISLTLGVFIVLFQIILVLKNTYQTSNTKIDILNKKSVIVEKMYSDLNDFKIQSVIQCGDYCLDFTMVDSTVKRFSIDKENLLISYGDYVIKLDSTYSIGNIYFSNDLTNYLSSELSNGLLKISIPIYSSIIGEENIGINITLTYNTRQISVGEIYIADVTTDDCGSNEFCKDKTYAIGNEITYGNYKWHIISNEESTITLLMDSSQLVSRSHAVTGMTNYKWSTSYINSYLNETLLNTLINNGVNKDKISTSFTGICDDATSSGGNPGFLSSQGITCSAGYTYSNIRMLTIDEYTGLKQYLIDNTLDLSFLYSETIGKWALMNGNSTQNTITQINTDGSTLEEAFNYLLNVRPVIVVNKK